MTSWMDENLEYLGGIMVLAGILVFVYAFFFVPWWGISLSSSITYLEAFERSLGNPFYVISYTVSLILGVGGAIIVIYAGRR